MAQGKGVAVSKLEETVENHYQPSLTTVQDPSGELLRVFRRATNRPERRVQLRSVDHNVVSQADFAPLHLCAEKELPSSMNFVNRFRKCSGWPWRKNTLTNGTFDCIRLAHAHLSADGQACGEKRVEIKSFSCATEFTLTMFIYVNIYSDVRLPTFKRHVSRGRANN